MKKQILNIANVIRAYEPRDASIDLYHAFKEQLRLMNENNLCGTFLIQYDALVMPEYTDILKTLPKDRFEMGIWYEVVEDLCNDCGLEWTGRFSWDWHCHCCYPLGYKNREREILTDQIFRKFKEIFGYYPKSFGGWLFDTHTIRYMNDKYEVDALCCCKEQYGTDGYTLWGGVYGQAYYPSDTNWFIPAKDEASKLNIPMFRMLGCDPVYQYDFGLDIEKGADPIQSVISLEPVYPESGGNEAWVDWYLKENFSGNCLSFGYAQAGQENNFGWHLMGEGLEFQFRKFRKLADEGKLDIMTMGEAGRYFKETYKDTPPAVILAETAYNDKDIKSMWYSCKNYRINIYADHGKVRIRDLYFYSDKIKDTYDEIVCEGNDATYEALPVIDGNRYSGGGTLCGGYFYDNDSEFTFCDFNYVELNNETAELTFSGKDGKIVITLSPELIKIDSEKADALKIIYGKHDYKMPEYKSVNNEILFKYNDIEYNLKLNSGSVEDKTLVFDNNLLEIDCSRA